MQILRSAKQSWDIDVAVELKRERKEPGTPMTNHTEPNLFPESGYSACQNGTELAEREL
jgi:hypothetical protein